jgi:hypothetical protein
MGRRRSRRDYAGLYFGYRDFLVYGGPDPEMPDEVEKGPPRFQGFTQHYLLGQLLAAGDVEGYIQRMKHQRQTP